MKKNHVIKDWEVGVKNLADLKIVAERLAAQIQMGDWIWLEGDLGAGKTTLVREILRAWGLEGTIPSPTYALLNEYELWSKKIFHIDAFRLAEAENVKPFEAPWDLQQLQKGIVFVEWPERSGLPTGRFSVKIRIEQDEGDESARRLLISRLNS